MKIRKWGSVLVCSVACAIAAGFLGYVQSHSMFGPRVAWQVCAFVGFVGLIVIAGALEFAESLKPDHIRWYEQKVREGKRLVGE